MKFLVLLLSLLLSLPAWGATEITLDQGDGTHKKWGGDGDAAKVTQSTLIAGERLQDQPTKSYLAVRTEANAAIIGKTTAVTIGGGSASDTHLLGIHISTALTGTCVLAGFADSDGVATNYTLPVGSVGFKDFLGILNTAGALTVTCSNASDDNLVMVLWRPAI
jgi:hypothetical protein